MKYTKETREMIIDTIGMICGTLIIITFTALAAAGVIKLITLMF